MGLKKESGAALMASCRLLRLLLIGCMERIMESDGGTGFGRVTLCVSGADGGSSEAGGAKESGWG